MNERADPELAVSLRALYDELDGELRTTWNRSLPFQDALIDRWDRARRLGFGPDASIYASAVVLGAVEVGDFSWIGPNVLLDGSGGGIAIGRWCSVSAGAQVYTHDTVERALTLGRAPQHTGAVRIGDGCHLGALSLVVAGVEIGDQCVVGANSLVNRSIPARSIAFGTPARVVGHVEVDGDRARLMFDDGDT
ncbi:MAG: acyltransferase [Acidimicrobiales bacterium]